MNKSWKTELGEMSDLEALKVRVAFGVSILVALIIVIALPLRNAITPVHAWQLLQSIMSLSLCALGAMAIRMRPSVLLGRYGVLAAILLFPVSAGYFSGGLDAPVMPLVVLIPLIAGFVAGKRAAVAFSIIAVVIVTVLYLLKMHGILPPTALTTEDAVNRARFVNMAALLTLGFGVALLYETTRQSELQARELLDAERTSKIRIAKLASLGEMAAGVAHEINNPLAIVVGAVRALPKVVGDSEKLSARIETIEKATERIAKIVRSLKKFSRSSDRVQYSAKSLRDILQEALILTDAKSKSHATPVSTVIETDGLIVCDEIEIEQVLVNLISNAVDAVQTKDDRWVEVTLKEQNFKVVLQIKDSGRGIPREVQEKLFQPFFTTKGVGEGTGLGLSIVKGILDEHKASIEVLDSDNNTCFEIKFPKAEIASTAV